MDTKFFKNRAEFRRWLAGNHSGADELWVGYYKKATGLPSITYSESLDEALCFGWIDGLRKSIDEQSYHIRFTPRRAGSRWSETNMERVKKLEKLGRMKPAGMRAFETGKRYATPSSRKSRDIQLSRPFEEKLKSNSKAWKYFNSLAPSLRRMSAAWVMDAKKEETQLRRLAVLIESSENGRRIPPLIISRKKGG